MCEKYVTACLSSACRLPVGRQERLGTPSGGVAPACAALVTGTSASAKALPRLVPRLGGVNLKKPLSDSHTNQQPPVSHASAGRRTDAGLQGQAATPGCSRAFTSRNRSRATQADVYAQRRIRVKVAGKQAGVNDFQRQRGAPRPARSAPNARRSVRGESVVQEIDMPYQQREPARPDTYMHDVQDCGTGRRAGWEGCRGPLLSGFPGSRPGSRRRRPPPARGSGPGLFDVLPA